MCFIGTVCDYEFYLLTGRAIGTRGLARRLCYMLVKERAVRLSLLLFKTLNITQLYWVSFYCTHFIFFFNIVIMPGIPQGPPPQAPPPPQVPDGKCQG